MRKEAEAASRAPAPRWIEPPSLLEEAANPLQDDFQVHPLGVVRPRAGEGTSRTEGSDRHHRRLVLQEERTTRVAVAGALSSLAHAGARSLHEYVFADQVGHPLGA